MICDWMAGYMGASSINMIQEFRDSIASINVQAVVPVFPCKLLTYISDRLYLAAYTTPPGPDTVFPYPVEQPSRRSPSKRSSRAIDGPAIVSDKRRVQPYYFSVDESLLYNAFHHDFGPLHIGHLYRFAVQFHDILGAPENKGKPVVFWSKADARSMYTYSLLPSIANKSQSRPSERRMLTCVLYGIDSIMGTSFGPCANCPGRSASDAVPRCWL